MSILGRVADLFQAKTNKLLNVLEDPNDTLDLSYEKMLTGLQTTKGHLADVVAKQLSLERQIGNIAKEIAGAENDAVTAATADRDDLARAALVHRRHAMDTGSILGGAHDVIVPQVEKLAQYQRLLEDRIEKFRTQKDAMKASYAAARTQVQVTQSLTGVGPKLGTAYQQAEDKILAMRDKADAIEGMVSPGSLTPPVKHDGSISEIAQLRSEYAVEDDLVQLKKRLGIAATTALSAP